MAKSKAKVSGADPEYGSEDYQAQSDADTLTKAAEIQGDGDRHERATAHLAKKAGSTAAAHKTARKQLEKKVKGGMKKAFPSDDGQGGDSAAPKKGKNFQQTKDSEEAEAY